ncbi:MAG: ABC transporter permease subunit [Chthonomonadales bacterium]
MKRLGLRLVWIVLVVALVEALSVGAGNLRDYVLDIIVQCGIAVILAVSLNIVNGFTGQFSIGHAGFMAVGAYVGGAVSYLVWVPAQEAIAKAHPSWGSDQVLAAFAAGHFWVLPVAMILGGCVAALFGWAVGLPSLRLRGDYLAIVTLGFGEIIRVLLENANKISPAADFLGGAVGFYGIPHIAGFFHVFVTAALVIVLTRNLKFSLHGLAYQSVREDEVAADAMGVDTTRVKVAAFALAAFFAGMGGALFAHAYFFVPKTFNFILSMNYVVMIVLGGTGSITGATLSAIVLTTAPEVLKLFKDRIPGFKDEYRLVLYALLLIIMMLLRPQGVFGRTELTFRRRQRRPSDAASPPGPVVPIHRSDEGVEALRLREARKSFGGLMAVDGISLYLKQGELVGLIGPNGAGKTTVFNLMTGVYELSSGEILFEGRLLAGERLYPAWQRAALLIWDGLLMCAGGWIAGSIVSTSTRASVTGLFTAAGFLTALVTAGRRRRFRPALKPYQFAQAGIARTFQNIRLFPELTVLENVMIGAYVRRRTTLWDALFRTARMEREDAAVEAFARALLARFNLDAVADEPAKSLPYGAQRRLEIARALATHPRLLLLDEPAAGMNPQEKVALMEDILRIREEFGLTILLIEHDMRVVMSICERIYVLDYGEIIAEGTPEQVRSDPKVIAAYLGQETPAC